MRNTRILIQVLASAVLAGGALTALAAEGKFYDPSNAASKSGVTVGHDLFGTIGCPGRGLLDSSCPKPPTDTDGDGVTDAKDRCPNTPPGMKVDADGCEPDADKDGVADRLDKCPGTQAGRKVNAEGCELDADGDGVVDGQDRCPNTPKGRKVGANGCELDADGDGVVDANDKCPNTPPGRKVGTDGCELDSDGDGVVDAADKCPTVFAKTADGCPPPKLVLEGVNFANDQARLTAESTAILDEAAATLAQWGDVKVEVAGHTDDRGSDDYNMALSQRRAEAVRAYLIGKGIAADRLSAKGYGESAPVVPNDSDANRYKNRRVELVPMQ